MMWRSSFILLMLLSSCAVTQLGRTNDINFIYQDPVGQLYEQYSNGRLHKRDVPTDTTYVYFDNLLGSIDWVDAANPFRPLLYFEDFQIIVLLDRTLNELARLDLREISQIEQAGAVARGLEDEIWVFDAGTFRLRLLDERGQLRLESDDLRRSLGINSPPASLFARRSWVVAWWPERGLARFSNVGQFLEWIELPKFDRWSWQGMGLLLWELEADESVGAMWFWEGRGFREVECPTDLVNPRGILLMDEGCRSW